MSLQVGSIRALSSTGTITLPANNKIVGLDAGSVGGSGQIIQVRYAQTPPTTYTISSTGIAAISGLSISFTPRFATSRILLQAMINHNAQYVTSLGFLKNGGYIGPITRAVNNSSDGSVSTVYFGAGTTDIGYAWNSFVQYYDTAGDTTARTYAAAASTSWSSVAYSLIINDRTSNDMRSISSFVIMEIAQ